MRNVFIVLILAVLATSMLLAQGKDAPPPAPGPLPEAPKQVKADDIKGTITNVRIANKSGETIPAGEPLVIEFDYETTAPNEAAIAADLITGDESSQGAWVNDAIAYEPFLLSEAKGKGKLTVRYGVFGGLVPSTAVKEIQLFLVPANGAPGRRDVTKVQGPIKLEGTELFSPTQKERIARLEREIQELKRTVESLQQKPAAK